jgi:hypothetical protein
MRTVKRLAHGSRGRGLLLATASGALVLVAGACTAYAQGTPSPFAGTWRGTLTASFVTVCNGSTQTCTRNEPWTGTVDAQGQFNGVYGPGTEDCVGLGGGSSTTASFSRSYLISSTGAALEHTYTPSLNGNGASCNLNVQYSSSPSLAMSGVTSGCPSLAASAPGLSCTETYQYSNKGSGVPAVFPMVVTGSIGPTVSNITAAIQYRPQDVGTSGSVYTFAVAPSTIVKSAPGKSVLPEDVLPPLGYATRADDGTKDTAVACVLAQLNSSGQLQAVTVSSLQAYVSGVLSSAGQAVNVINGVATANIGGATFYVGYGTSASSMLSSGVNRNVVAVPGALECKPQAPQTGWWWNASESGRGYTIESSGNKLFIATYLYDVTGRSTWYVSAGPTSLDGSLYTGNLESYANGQTLTGAYRAPTLPPTIAGTISLAFSDATHGTLVWPGGTVAIKRYEYGTGGVNAIPQANQPESGWWWNKNESGRGYFIEWQGGTAVMAGYLYEADGHSAWYYAAAQTPNAQALSANWSQYANGQTLTGAYKPATQANPNVGPVTIQFQGAQDGIMTLPGGRQVPITRYRF